MPKTTIDWEAAMELSCAPAFRDNSSVFAVPVAKMEAQIMKKIEKADSNRSKLPFKVAELVEKPAVGKNVARHLWDQYVLEAAVLAVFGRFNILDKFYEEVCDPSAQVETKDGWHVFLQRPIAGGLFQVEFLPAIPDRDTDVEKILYQAVA